LAVFSCQDFTDLGGLPIDQPAVLVVQENNEAWFITGHLNLVESVVKPAAPFYLSVILSGKEVTTK
jgi:hypothetical protein